MIETKTPGIQATHIVITPACRENRTPFEAFETAIDKLHAAYWFALEAKVNEAANLHIVLTVER